ncbi:hypothetical protein PE36_11582 [Moritella sp. PE36]|nr:hypothetical protein PE36_11582 [Moritella sp. PE36]
MDKNSDNKCTALHLDGFIMHNKLIVKNSVFDKLLLL